LASSAALPKLKLIDFGNAQSSTKKTPVAPELLQWVGDDTVIQKEFACFGLLRHDVKRLFQQHERNQTPTVTVGTRQESKLWP